jgi:hypothetical protein
MTSLKKTNIFSKIINIYILALKDINIQISATGLRILIKKYKNTGSVGNKKRTLHRQPLISNRVNKLSLSFFIRMLNILAANLKMNLF